MTSMRGGSRSYQTEGRSRRAGYPLHSVGAVTERTSSPQPLGTAQETLPDWRSGFTAIENPSRWREDRDTLHHVHLIKRLRGFSPRGRFTCTLPRPLHWIIMTTACFGTVCLSNAEASSEGSLGITTWISPFYDKEICSVNRNNAPRDPCSCIEAYVHGNIRIFKREIGAS